MSDKVVISAALAGSVPMKGQNPAVPYTPQEFADEARRCMDEGATVVHLHGRDPVTGARTGDLDVVRNITQAIRERCPGLLINLTTSGRSPETDEHRIAPVVHLEPDLASLNTNSMNFASMNWKTGEVRSEFVYENRFATMIMFAKAMREHHTKPECEIFDLGGLYNVLLVRRQGLFEEPMHFQFVFGVAGGIPYDVANFARVREVIPPDASWSACGVGPQQFQAGMTAAVNGGHIRVGLEDNLRMPDRELAKGSWEQVRWAAQVARMAGRDVASPEEARALLHLPTTQSGA